MGQPQPQSLARAVVRSLVCDTSQCVSRRPWGASVTCLTTCTELYSFRREGFVSGSGLLALQGIPTEVPTGELDSAEKANLAAEAMFAPNIASLLLGVFLNRAAPWWEPQRDILQ